MASPQNALEFAFWKKSYCYYLLISTAEILCLHMIPSFVWQDLFDKHAMTDWYNRNSTGDVILFAFNTVKCTVYMWILFNQAN